jgi:hypothetical protein
MKIWKKCKLKSEKMRKIRRVSKLDNEKYGNYGGKESWIVKWYGKYGRKVVEYWNDMENIEEK